MQFYLINTALEIVDIIETYKSVIWATRYYESGDFELYIPATVKMLNTLKKNYYVVRDDDTTKCMIIESIQITTDIEEGNYLIVRGRSLKSVLSRRIVWSQTILNGYVELCIRQLVTSNAINPDIEDRKINNLILGAEIGLTDKMKSQYTGDNLEEVIQGICRSYGIGYDILLDLDNKKFIFVLFKGSDRSYNQKVNQYVVFSNDFENLLRTNYSNDSTNFKNVARVAGEGEGTARKHTTVGSASDLERYEIYVDARDLSTNDGEIDDDTYNNLLTEKGTESLSQYAIIETMEGEVEANHTYTFNQDYYLGDIVEVVNEYGIETTPRITEVIECDDDTGYYTIPTFATDTN